MKSESDELEILPLSSDDLTNQTVEDDSTSGVNLQDPLVQELNTQLLVKAEVISSNEAETQTVSLPTEINQSLIEVLNQEEFNAEVVSESEPVKDKKKLGRSFVKRVKSFKLPNKKRSKNDEFENENKAVVGEASKLIDPEPLPSLETDKILIITVVVLTEENREAKRRAEEKAEAVLVALTKAALMATQKGGSEARSHTSPKLPPISTPLPEVQSKSKHRP